MPISPGAPRTLPVGFLAPCSRLPGCAGCTSFFSMQRVVVCWWWSSTSDWLRSTACPVLNTCSAKADVWTSPFFSARRCSLTCCLRLLPVWSMYTLEHSTQEMEYTTPLRSSIGTGSFGSRVPASGGEFIVVRTLPWPLGGLGHV